MRESDLLEHIYAASRLLPAGVTIGPGDDMGAVRLPGAGDAGDLLVAVDQVIDGLHFDLAAHPIDLIGRKAVTRNLSDVAAMAGEPVACVVAAQLPRGFDRADALFDAVRSAATAYACPAIGGDIAIGGGPLALAVTVLARPGGVEPVLRSGAEPGDALYVTGQLGDTLATGHHLSFEPRLAVARALAGDPGARPTAMIDLSDGIARDLPRLVAHAQLDAAALPARTPGLDWRRVVGDGEDYELLFAAGADQAVPDRVAGVAVTRIGRVADAGGCVVVTPDGRRHDLAGLGWDHG